MVLAAVRVVEKGRADNRGAYRQVVWPRANVKGSQMSHDAYSCNKYHNARPFPTRRPPDFQHVGQARLAAAWLPNEAPAAMHPPRTTRHDVAALLQVFFGDGRPRMGDITDFMINKQAPRLCRGDPSWVNG